MSEPDANREIRRNSTRGPSFGVFVRSLIVVALVVGTVWLYRNYSHWFSLEFLASKEAELRQFRIDNPYLVYGIAFLIYVVVTGLSLPGAAVLSLTYAWYFGFWRALVLVSFASTAGATVAFLLSRFLFREVIQRKFGDRLRKFNEALEQDGAFYLFTLRLIPSVPFFLINVVMGLTPVRTVTYWWVSQVGMLPGTVVYVFAGSQFPDLKTLADRGIQGIFTPPLLIAFALLGVFPLAVKWVVARLRSEGNA